MAVGIYKIHAFDEGFFLLTIRMAMVYQIFHGGDMLRGPLTQRYAWHLNREVFGVTWQVKYISPPAEDYEQKIRKALTYRKRFPNMTLLSSEQREVMWHFAKSKSPLSQAL